MLPQRFIDDTTGKLLQACFHPVECTNAGPHSLQCYMGAHGTVPATTPSRAPRHRGGACMWTTPRAGRDRHSSMASSGPSYPIEQSMIACAC